MEGEFVKVLESASPSLAVVDRRLEERSGSDCWLELWALDGAVIAACEDVS